MNDPSKTGFNCNHSMKAETITMMIDITKLE